MIELKYKTFSSVTFQQQQISIQLDMTLHILDIPAEILLIIFSHLPSQTLITQIPLVCRHFRDLVATHWYWKMHYVHLAGSQPLKERELLREWQEGCIQSEFANAAARKKLSLSSLTGTVVINWKKDQLCVKYLISSEDLQLYIYHNICMNPIQGVGILHTKLF